MDPIADLVSTIKNCQAVRKNRAEVGYSKIKEGICRILSRNAIIDHFEIKKDNGRQVIVVYLKDDQRIYHLRRISKPGRRVYVKSRDIKTPLSGLGFLIISTPRGIVESREAKKLGLGGEIICEVW